MSTTRPAVKLAALAATVVLATALSVSCGGDDDTGGTAGTSPTADTSPVTEAADEDPVLVWKVTHADEDGVDQELFSIAVSPDGVRFATGYDRVTHIRQLADGSLLDEFGVDSWVSELAFTPDGSWLAGGSHIGSWWLHDTTGAVDPIRMDTAGLRARISIAPDGRTIAASAQMGDSVSLSSVADGTLLDTIGLPHSDWLDGIEYHPGGEIISVTDRRCTIMFLDVRTGAMIGTIGPSDEECDTRGAARPSHFAPDGTLLAHYTSRDGQRRIDVVDLGNLGALGDLSTTTVVHSFAFDDVPKGLTFSSDGSMLGVIGLFEARIYDIGTGDLLHVLDHAVDVMVGEGYHDGRFTPDDGHLLIARYNGVELWRLPGAGELPTP